MGISAIEDSYEEAKRRAKLFYQGIGRVWCPALKDYIAFDERGFRHLIQKGRRFRMKSEHKRRLRYSFMFEQCLNLLQFSL